MLNLYEVYGLPTKVGEGPYLAVLLLLLRRLLGLDICDAIRFLLLIHLRTVNTGAKNS